MTLAPMGGDAPAAALVVAAAALPSSPHISVCARRAAFARAPSSPLRLVRPLAPAGADGGAVGAQKAARPSRRVRCAPPVAACARARVRLRGKQRWGGLLAPSGGCAAAAPPPPPPVKCWGRGLWLSCVRCGGVAPAAAGARSSHGLSLGIMGQTLRKMVGGVETYA